MKHKNNKPEIDKLTQTDIAKLNLAYGNNILYICDYYAILFNNDNTECKIYCHSGFLNYTFSRQHIFIKKDENSLSGLVNVESGYMYLISKYGIFNSAITMNCEIIITHVEKNLVFLGGYNNTYLIDVTTGKNINLDNKYFSLSYLGNNKYRLLDSKKNKMQVIDGDLNKVKNLLIPNAFWYKRHKN